MPVEQRPFGTLHCAGALETISSARNASQCAHNAACEGIVAVMRVMRVMRSKQLS